MISDRFAKIENRIEELTLHFGRIHDQLHELCEVISSNFMLFSSRDNGMGITCRSELCLEDDYDIISIHSDNVFGLNIEIQEVTLNDAFVTPLEEYLVPIGSKSRIAQVIPGTYLLMNSQVMYEQSDTYKIFRTGKLLPTLLSFGYVVHIIEPPFIDPPRPELVDYSLTKPP